jgi:hypothetical protein
MVVQTMLCMFLVKVMYIYLVPNSYSPLDSSLQITGMAKQ